MKSKLFLFCVLLICYITINAQQAIYPTFTISGQRLLNIFSTYEFLVGHFSINSATKNVTITFEGIRTDGSTTTFTNADISLQTVVRSYPEITDDNTKLLTLGDNYKCSTDHRDFDINTGHTYFIIPSRIRDAESGNFFMSYRIQYSKSPQNSFYKTINPIPPGGSR